VRHTARTCGTAFAGTTLKIDSSSPLERCLTLRNKVNSQSLAFFKSTATAASAQKVSCKKEVQFTLNEEVVMSQSNGRAKRSEKCLLTADSGGVDRPPAALEELGAKLSWHVFLLGKVSSSAVITFRWQFIAETRHGHSRIVEWPIAGIARDSAHAVKPRWRAQRLKRRIGDQNYCGR